MSLLGRRRDEGGRDRGDPVGCWRVGCGRYGSTACGCRIYTGRNSCDSINLREHPEAYRIGLGEQGIFHAEPYKSELLPLWSFKDAAVEIFYEKWREARALLVVSAAWTNATSSCWRAP